MIGLAAKAGKVVFGTEACITAINKKKVKLIIIAKDASQRTKNNFFDICKKNEVDIIDALDINTLSKSIGKNNKAVIGIVDINFSSEIVKIIDGGEAIG